MNATAFKQIEITQHLSLLTEQQLEQINQYLKTIFVPVCENNQSLKGIWKNKGFEKLDDAAELKQIRQEMNQSILQRVI